METKGNNLPADPRQWVKDLEAIWQARDGVEAAKGFTEDAVQVWGTNQRQTGPELATRPAKWFAYAKDLNITKKYLAHSDDTIVASWNSTYTHPETGQKVFERGIEYFVFREGLVAEQHAWQHSWNEGDVSSTGDISTD
jgi:hypothetical protein